MRNGFAFLPGFYEESCEIGKSKLECGRELRGLNYL